MDDPITLNCVILDFNSHTSDGEVFQITIPRNSTIYALKETIKNEFMDEMDQIPTPRLSIWTADIPMGNDLNSSVNSILQSSQKALAPVHLSFLFPKVNDQNIHILVKQSASINPSTSTKFQMDASLPHAAVKRSRSPDVVPEERKRSRTSDIPAATPHPCPSEDALRSLYSRLQNINPDPSYYSDPQHVVDFPFSFLHTRLPVDRFRLSNPPTLVFKYMGRESFAEVWKLIDSFKVMESYIRLHINGTIGYGKSHILAVVAGLLSRTGKRTVYIPDCARLLRNPMIYMQCALLCAFADPSSSDVRATIRAFESLEALEKFCVNHAEHFYFVVDQMNALDTDGPNMNSVCNRTKDDVRDFLNRITDGYSTIESASANYKTALKMEHRQASELRLSLMGGMSKKEMKHWWIHYDTLLPILEGDDKAMVEDRTGRVPLFLRPLFGLDRKPFHEVEGDYWTHHEIVGVGTNIRMFANTKYVDLGERKYQSSYLAGLHGCLTATTVENLPRESFDYRYFYLDNTGTGSVTCGLAREAAAAILRKGQPGRLFDKEWLSALRTFKNNSSVVGFMVEQACLSIISEMGFHHGDLHGGSVPATIFKGDLIQYVHLGDQNTFFVPENPYFKDIDALFLRIHEPSKTALVVPFQITINKKHKDSEAAFYSGWARWKALLEGYKVQTCFVWITEDDQSWEELEAESRMTRSGQQEVSPPHMRLRVPVKALHPVLGAELSAIRRLL